MTLMRMASRPILKTLERPPATGSTPVSSSAPTDRWQSRARQEADSWPDHVRTAELSPPAPRLHRAARKSAPQPLRTPDRAIDCRTGRELLKGSRALAGRQSPKTTSSASSHQLVTRSGKTGSMPSTCLARMAGPLCSVYHAGDRTAVYEPFLWRGLRRAESRAQQMRYSSRGRRATDSDPSYRTSFPRQHDNPHRSLDSTSSE